MNTGGYDGKGVQVIKGEEDLKHLWDVPSVLENLVDIGIVTGKQIGRAHV